jgi:hypothetical protein
LFIDPIIYEGDGTGIPTVEVDNPDYPNDVKLLDGIDIPSD